MTNNFITKINLGGQIYNIGMESAIHFDGTALIGTWHSASTLDAPLATLAADQGTIYSALTINDIPVTVGCMYIPVINSAASNFEVVCTAVRGGFAEWAVLGNLTKQHTSINVISGAIGTAAAAAKSLVDGVTPQTAAIKAFSNFNAGRMSYTTATISGSASVAGGGATLQSASVNIPKTTVSASSSKVGITLGTSTVSVAKTTVTTAASKVGITLSATTKAVGTTLSTGVTAAGSGSSISVVGDTLVLPAQVITAAASNVLTRVALNTEKISVPTKATMDSAVLTSLSVGTAAGTSITIPTAATLNNSVLTTLTVNTAVGTSINIPTAIDYTNPTVTLPEYTVVDSITYQAPKLDSTDVAVVTDVTSTTDHVGVFATNASVVTSVPTVATSVLV